ncbi:glycoside hydrolase [Phyllobacterium salinisoli]|uniref:Glycoside hydrolase n=1 Tax=Phyllobacterium salinisoli TaxID=1899321 RepID=A0A368K948_9HYPH|nr:GH25 family lysozyme [Phyllobacterium salinisoli]RCS25888.1 glycoside hydrolase [Phyllobacterium salinisoli]
MKRTATVMLSLFLSALSLSACTTVDYDFSEPAKTVRTERKVTFAYPAVRAPKFGDRKPHEWKGKTPWHYAVHGTDVSKYQSSIDWKTARESGISFVFIKATEGGDRADERFAEHWSKARAVGMPRGAYHFFYFCRPAIEQAQWFIRHVPRDPGALPPVLDMEWNHLSPTCKRRPEASVVRREMQVFLDMVERHYGKRPIIYTTVDFFDENGLESMKEYPFWLRSVAGHPSEKYGSHPWTFWQYTGTGKVPGIDGDADINVFAGSPEQWRNWVEGKKR